MRPRGDGAQEGSTSPDQPVLGRLQSREWWLFLSDQFQPALQPLRNAERVLSQCASPSQSLGCSSLAFRKEFQDAGLRSSSFFSSFEESDIENHLISGHNIVQPTDIEENRTMLFTVKYYQASCTSPVWSVCSKENLLS